MEITNPRLKGLKNDTQNITDVKVKTLNLRDRQGVEVPTSCVEFTVIGKNNGAKWRDFLTIEEFTQSNPDLLAELISK